MLPGTTRDRSRSTLAGLRRRGVPPEAIREFVRQIGVARANSLVDLAMFDGAVRDVTKMTAMDFPIFARGVSPYDSQNRQRVIDVDVTVEIDEVKFSPGDLVIADVDGVVVVTAGDPRRAFFRSSRCCTGAAALNRRWAYL